ncbi:hypothetical protein DI09_30p10 [Mitosporidium daphniae]|uniref:Mitochondrial pyruvate carrier n=1 Tax=Mitosporidium daphniae TaxID=1485682 RepID=A0A098VRJ0_9MICR|nr:uncharacterized protein DI09_30p10 [Mitosporidium daphniae]KGG51585.1 hypothetical protein DI09_30p10 [Mitosporidium daphniae]|eukprot:XP_013238043.1 uncharacterized protein DI09_30p10 [Mitosporidium daphniae]
MTRPTHPYAFDNSGPGIIGNFKKGLGLNHLKTSKVPLHQSDSEPSDSSSYSDGDTSSGTSYSDGDTSSGTSNSDLQSPKNLDSSSSDASDDSNASSDSERSLVDVNFEFFDIEPADGQYLLNMISDLLAPLSISAKEISRLVDTLVSNEREFTGSTIKLVSHSDAEDSDASSSPKQEYNAPIAFIGTAQALPETLKRHCKSARLVLKCHSILNFPPSLTPSLLELFSKENKRFPHPFCLVVKTASTASSGKSNKKSKTWECIYPDDEILSELAVERYDLPTACEEGRPLVADVFGLVLEILEPPSRLVVAGGCNVRRTENDILLGASLQMGLPASQLSLYQSSSLSLTGFIWARYSTQITPVNMSLFVVNFFLGCTGLVQATRICLYGFIETKRRYKYSQQEADESGTKSIE